ncbi:MAG: hypothetical protein LAT68_09445 [Cyclobacteriaceae bacterium]|nr:hypothetical protein [Cyclobacteriaceae bacterium]MCH8516538.1 hypothetical protein [Cyclobacteriaceae bacterium]
MEQIGILLLILIGLAMIVVEVVFIPGVAFVGLLGLVLMTTGVVLSFQNLGVQAGWISLGSALLGSLVVFIYALRQNSWSRFSLNKDNQGKVNEDEDFPFEKGMQGKTVSALRPFGYGEFHNKRIEIVSKGDFVDEGTPIEIIKVEGKKIIVKPI